MHKCCRRTRVHQTAFLESDLNTKYEGVVDAKCDLTYDILGIRSTELNMVGNKNDGPAPHNTALNTLFE